MKYDIEKLYKNQEQLYFLKEFNGYLRLANLISRDFLKINEVDEVNAFMNVKKNCVSIKKKKYETKNIVNSLSNEIINNQDKLNDKNIEKNIEKISSEIINEVIDENENDENKKDKDNKDKNKDKMEKKLFNDLKNDHYKIL